MKPLQELVNLQNKTAIVTGGGKGISQGIAYRLAEAGAKVLIADLDEKAATATAEAFLHKIPMHRMGTADEIGTVALFLASDMSNYMTSSQIVVDGGALLT